MDFHSNRVPSRKPEHYIISCDTFTFKGIDSRLYHNSDLEGMREIQFIQPDILFKNAFPRTNQEQCYWICYSQSPEAQPLLNGTLFCYVKTMFLTNFEIICFSSLHIVIDSFSRLNNSSIHIPYKLR